MSPICGRYRWLKNPYSFDRTFQLSEGRIHSICQGTARPRWWARYFLFLQNTTRGEVKIHRVAKSKDSEELTEEEALANIASAIQEYLEAEIEPKEGAEIREIEVAV